MSTVKNILSLASKSHGLHLEGLIHAIASELRNALIANTEGLDEDTLEKLRVWSEMILPEMGADCIPLSENCQIPQGREFHDMLLEVWQLLLHRFISKASLAADKASVAHFLGGSISLLSRDDAKQCLKELTDKLHALITCDNAEVFDGSETLLPCLLQIMENMLCPQLKGCIMSATQKEVMTCLQSEIVSSAGIITTRSIHHAIGIFIKSMRRFENDDDFRLVMWENILEAFISIGKSIQANELHEVTGHLQHCLHLLDTLLGLSVSTNRDALVKNIAEMLANGVPWLVIQCGLKHHIASVRKLALFNLRQTLFIIRERHLDVTAMATISDNAVDCNPIFVWTENNSDDSFWRDFLLLAETLEENQLHVITPVLKRLDAMVAKTNPQEYTGKCPFHASWICILLQRMMSHESKAVCREGVLMSLKLNPHSCPFLEQYGGEDFLIGTNSYGLFPALQDISLFCDSKDAFASSSAVGELPFIATLMTDFLQKCFAAHQNPARFLKFLLEAVNTVNWAAVPLFYFCRSLLYLPECKAWDGQDLQNFQSVVMKCLRTHDIRLRHSILNLLLQCLTKFAHCSDINLDEFLSIITLSNEKGLLNKCPQLYKKILHWLYHEIANFKGVAMQNWQDISAFTFHRIMQFCNRTSENNLPFNGNLKQAHMNSLLSLSLVIAKEKATDERNFLKEVIAPLNDVIEKGCTHLYLPKEKVSTAILSVNCLVVAWLGLQLRQLSDKCPIGKVLLKTMKSIQSYALMRFSMGYVGLDDMKLYLSTWRNCFSLLLQLEEKCSWQQQLLSEFSPLIKTANTVFEKASINKEITEVEELKNAACSLYILSWICTIAEDFGLSLNHAIMEIIREFLKKFDLCAKAVSGRFVKNVETREIIEEYSLFQWSCIPYAMRMDDMVCCVDRQQSLESFLNCLEKVSETHIATYFDALAAIIKSTCEFKEVMQDLMCDCLDLSWKTVKSLTHSPSFWRVFQSFVSAFFQSSVLSLPPASKIQQKLQNTLSLLMEISLSKAGVLKIVCDSCISAWTNSRSVHVKSSSKHYENSYTRYASLCRSSINPQILESYTDFITQCIVFNPSRKKEDLALQNALKLPDITSDLCSLDSGDVVRLSMVSMLLQLDPESLSDCELVHSIVKQLLLLDVQLMKKKMRYHHNSFHHHVKNSIHQAVLVLSPFIPKDKDSFLLEHLKDQLKNDAQPSVRYLMEWMLALIVNITKICFLKLIKDLNNSMPRNDSDRFHLLNQGVKKMKRKYFLKLVNICWPWCISQHFSIRLYALAVILRIQMYFDETGDGDILKNAHPSLSSCLQFADNATGNVAKNWEKIKENFFLFDFHPTRDFSVETIYFTLPRLCCVPCGSSLKEIYGDSCSKHRFRSGLPLHNSCAKLGKRGVSKWIPQESRSCDFVGEQSQRSLKNSPAQDNTDTTNISAAEYNVQKKIMPWLEMAGSFLEESEAPRAPGLVLVASLIDKPSNLGGLTRTCEIFGAEALVVQSLSCTTDKLYQSLSVTAHQWLPMKEIKAWNLEQFLIEMRKKGYFLVGIEQTAHSVCLSKYRFPRRCVLVLGNEKEGIPITLLRVLDVCVQIPQKGIVRSLNVHVSGALAVWEYTRQHLSCDQVSSNTFDHVK